jgi:DNA-binding YbaB/EbfC family protein
MLYMARGGFPGGGFGGGGFGGGNMNNLMKQAQKMQKDMEKTQQDLENKTVEVSVGGGAISIVATGKKEIKEITIKPEVVDPDDVEMLQDLILSAVNEALRKADELANSEMGKITGGLGGFPGLF